MKSIRPKRIISDILIVLLTVISVVFVSCRNSDSSSETENASGITSETETEAISSDNKLPADCELPGVHEVVSFNNCCTSEWNGYIIGSADVITGRANTPLKYNFSSDTTTPICMDPMCTHDLTAGDCPFSYFGDVVGVWNDRLYYTRCRIDADTVCNILSSYGLTDGKTQVYWEISFQYPSPAEMRAQNGSMFRDDTQKMPVMWMYGAYIFTTRYYPICDNPVRIEDYHQWLVCMNADTGSFTQLIDLTEEQIEFAKIFCVRDGCVYHLDAVNRFCELNLTTREDRVLLAPDEENGSLLLYNSYSGFVDNCFWYGELSGDMSTFRIKRLSLSDSTVETVTENQRSELIAFTVCDDTIYRIIVGNPVPDSRNTQFRIVRCDLDGNNAADTGSFEARAVFSVLPCANETKLFISLMQSGGCILYDPATGEQTLIPTPEE